MTFFLRLASPLDLPSIVSFNEGIALETEGLLLEKERLSHGVSAFLNDPSLGFYLLAFHQETVVGQLAVTFEWSDWRNRFFWWLQSVYVHPSWRRKGVYRALHARVRQMAHDDPKVCGLRLYVERQNTVAQTTYHALGMERSPYLVMQEDFVLGPHPLALVERESPEGQPPEK